MEILERTEDFLIKRLNVIDNAIDQHILKLALHDGIKSYLKNLLTVFDFLY